MASIDLSIFRDFWTLALMGVFNIIMLYVLLGIHRATYNVQKWHLTNLSGHYVDFGKYAAHQYYASFVKRRAFEGVATKIQEMVLQILGVSNADQLNPEIFPEEIRDEFMLFLKDPLKWKEQTENDVRGRSLQAVKAALLNRRNPYPRIREMLIKAKLVNE